MTVFEPITNRHFEKTSSQTVDRKWGFWLIDLGKFRKLGQFSFLNLNLAEKPKNKRKKYKNSINFLQKNKNKKFIKNWDKK